MILKFNEHSPLLDETSFVAEGAVIIGNVRIGKNSSIWYNSVLRGDVAAIIVGDNSNIQGLSAIHCDKGTDVKIGDNVTVGHGAILHSCTIGNNSLVGMGAIVLSNTVIGSNCLIGAGSLVTPGTVIPDGCLALGNPAKIKRRLTEDEIRDMTKNSHNYLTLSNEHRQNEPM